jgi:hypothetical protein
MESGRCWTNQALPNCICIPAGAPDPNNPSIRVRDEAIAGMRTTTGF